MNLQRKFPSSIKRIDLLIRQVSGGDSIDFQSDLISVTANVVLVPVVSFDG